jgi:hypothetical protein
MTPAAKIRTPTTQGAHGSAWCQKESPWLSTHSAAGGHTEIPLSRPPPRAPDAGQSPPQENQIATAHTMNPTVATTTAAPTVGPSKRLGLPPLTTPKARPA